MKLRLIFISILCMWFISCAKDDTTIPKRYIEPAFSIKEVQPGGTLEIYGKTTLHFDIKQQNPVVSYLIKLDDGITFGHTGYGDCWYEVNPVVLDGKHHTLVVTPTIEPQRAWMYEQDRPDTTYVISPWKRQFKYTLKYVLAGQKKTLKKNRTAEGCLSLSWENPGLKDAPVSHYEIHYKEFSRSGPLATVAADQTTFVDSTFFWGLREYILKTHFANEMLEPWEESITEQTSTYVTDATLGVEELPGQKIKISWTKPPYMAVYDVGLSGDGYIEKTLGYQDNYLITDAPAFPNSLYIHLGYLNPPKIRQYYDFDRLSCTYASAATIHLRSDYDLPAMSHFAYNRGNRCIYILHLSSVTRMNLSLNFTGSVYDNLLHYVYDDKLACSYDGSKIAILKRSNSGYANAWMDGFVILDQDLALRHNFRLPTDIRSRVFGTRSCEISIDDHNRAMLSVDNDLHVFNITDGSLIYSETMPVSEYSCKYIFSGDGKYIGQYSAKHLNVFEIGATGLIPVLSKDFSALNKCLFDPATPANIYIGNDGQTQRLSVLSGNVNSSTVRGALECLDPVTGHVACRARDEEGRNRLYIISGDLGEQIIDFRIEYDPDKYPHPTRKLSLYDDIIFAPGTSSIGYAGIYKYR